MKQHLQNQKEKKNKEYQIAVIHLSWLLVIVVLGAASIVGLFLSTDNSAFILSTISTVTSIILSIVAIIFTLFQAYKADQYNDEIKNVIYESMKDFTHDMALIQQFMRDLVAWRKTMEEENIDPKTAAESIAKIIDKTEEQLKSRHLSNTDFWFDD